MKKHHFLFIVFSLVAAIASAQTGTLTTSGSITRTTASGVTTTSFARRPALDSTAIVRDSAGVKMAYAEWHKLMASSDYALRIKNPGVENPEFVVIKLSEAAKARRRAMIPKPDEDGFVKTGMKLDLFSAKDIDGYKIRPKDLEGKVVVLNFWFIKCAPCRDEMPELNKIAKTYENNPNIVFIAVDLDSKDDIKEFLKTSPFAYHIIDDGKELADKYEIKSYPTNIVLDKEGKVKFHSAGYGWATVDGLAKAINEVK